MSPSRRQVVAAVVAAGVAPTSVVSAQEDGEDGEENQDENQEDDSGENQDDETQDEQDDETQDGDEEEDDEEFSPELSIRPNNLVARVGEREDGSDPDTVTVYTADESVFEFDGAAENDWERGEAFDVGYTRSKSRGEIEGWHGIVERVEATKDDETVAVENDGESTLDVTCTLWKTPDYPPTEFTVISDGSTKHHWNRGEDDLSEEQRQYGSPGRRLQTVVEHDPEGEMRVDFGERGCYPNERKALYFECTSVTVEEDELNQGEDRIEDVQLRFADGTFENPDGDADEADNGAFELPVTLEGSGENEGKIIENLHFKVPSGEYYYRNLDVEECRDQRDAESQDEEAGDDGEDSDAPEEGEEPTETPSEDEPGGADDESGGDGGDAGGEDTPSTDGEDSDGDAPEETADGSEPTPDGEDSDGDAGGTTETADGSEPTPDGEDSDGDAGGTTETASDGPSSQDSTEDGSSGGTSGGSTDAPTTDRSTAETRTADAETTEATEAPADDATATSTPADDPTETSGDGTGSGSGSGENGSAPGLPDGDSADEQAGLGIVAALGGLFGFGELARRRLSEDDEERPADPE